MNLFREQLEIAVNRLCQECVYAYVHRRDSSASFGRDMAIENVMSFFDELVKKNELH